MVRSCSACLRSRPRQDAAVRFLASGLLSLILFYNAVRISLLATKQNKTKKNSEFMAHVIINIIIICVVRRR